MLPFLALDHCATPRLKDFYCDVFIFPAFIRYYNELPAPFICLSFLHRGPESLFHDIENICCFKFFLKREGSADESHEDEPDKLLFVRKKTKLILTLKMVASNTSKYWEESDLFENYWFPFGFCHLLRNVLYVNNCLCGFDHFGPHPAIASDQPFCLDLPNPCELISKPQTQPFSPLCQNPLTDVTGSFISGLRRAFWSLDLFSNLNSHQRC